MEIKNSLYPLDPYNQTKLNNATQADQTQTSGRSAANVPAVKAEGDRVSFSPEAKLRTEVFSVAMNAPAMRADRVAALKAQVESGQYAVDSKAVASKLLQEEPGLLQP